MANITEIKEILTICGDNNIVPVLVGQPGIGKSSLVYQYAAEVSAKVVEFRPNLHDPVDVIGLPFKSATSTMAYLTPDWLPTETECMQYPKVVLFIDEFMQANQAMQNALSQLILDRKLGQYTLPKNVMIVVAGNRDSDRAATYKMPSHISNRLCRIDIDYSTKDFLQFCNDTNQEEHLKAFAKFRPNTLTSFDSSQPVNCTPRSIVSASKVINNSNIASNIRHEMTSGLIGEGAAAEYAGFLRAWNEIQNTDEILKDPVNAKVPKELDKQFAIAQMLIVDSSPHNVDQVMVYTKRLNIEVQVMFVKDLLQRDANMIQADSINDWAENNLDVLSAA